jgi:hypothetical protein
MDDKRRIGLATSNYFCIYKEHEATVQNNGKNKKGKDTEVFLLTIHKKPGEGHNVISQNVCDKSVSVTTIFIVTQNYNCSQKSDKFPRLRIGLSDKNLHQ